MRSRHFKNIIEAGILTFLLILIYSFNLYATDNIASGKQGMVATAHPLATEAGLNILKQGGNAIDAVVASAFAIGVVEPDASGVGGGGAMVIWLNDKKESVYINYYQKASEKVDKINYNSELDRHTAKAVLIPGTVDGLLTALERYGTMDRQQVMEPAIRYARDGFEIDGTLAGILLDNYQITLEDSESASIFTEEGFPRMEGDILVQENLAHTLELIAENGRDGFYGGSIAKDLVTRINNGGGVMTFADLQNYYAQIGVPVQGNYRGYDVIAAGPPQSGASVIEALHILENENLTKKGHYSESAQTLHIMAETFKRIYTDRFTFMEDPLFGEVPIRGIVSKDFALGRYHDINPYRAEPRKYSDTKPGNPFKYNRTSARTESGVKENKDYQWSDDVDDENSGSEDWSEDLFDSWGSRKKVKTKQALKKAVKDTVIVDEDDYEEYDGHTTHMSIIDKDGNAVSLTQTLGTFFGSGIMVDGFLLNCGMSNFSSTSEVNSVAPNKQPRSSISPTIILKNDEPYMVVGSPGAGRIISTVVELIVNGIDFSYSAQAANDAPRFYCQKFDEYLHVEGGISEGVIKSLKRKGHNIKQYGNLDLFFGGAQLILVDPRTQTYYGAADKRRGGIAEGY